MEPILSVEHLRRDYGGRGSVTHAVDDVSFSVERGEFVGIMGASGSGKSTLLNCIATIDTPTAGHIRVEGQDVTALKGRSLSRFRLERLGFVFQDCNLLDTLTAFENIALALTIRGLRRGRSRAGQGDGGAARHHRLPEQIPLPDVRRTAPADGGGPGHHHRPRPGAGRRAHRLDSRSAKLLLDRFEALNREGRATILMVTHAPPQATAAAFSFCRTVRCSPS